MSKTYKNQYINLRPVILYPEVDTLLKYRAPSEQHCLCLSI
jgi:hypothetical protein